MADITASTPENTRPSRREAWQRWVIIWHVVFYISLAVPTIAALLADELNRSRESVLVLSLALGIWYALTMIWLVPKAKGNWQLAGSIIYLLGAILLWFPLARTHWAYFITASSFYGLMWGTLPFWLAVIGNVLLTGLLIWIRALNLGKPVVLSGELFLIAGAVVGWAALLALWMRTIMRESAERKRLIEKLEAAQEDLATAERQAGVLEERQRMAREIHDTLAQGFTSIIMLLEAADQAFPQGASSAQDYVNKARQTARASLGEARRLVSALQPESLEKAPLPEALRREAARWTQNSGIESTYSVTGEPVSLHPQVEVTLLRGLQEGLANVRRHAEASLVNITLSYMPDQVALDIQDDGCGFDVHLLERPGGQSNGGFGLQAMRQRLEQIGGMVILESTPGQGTTLAIQVPIGEDGNGENSA